jgi:hypothetical protein
MHRGKMTRTINYDMNQAIFDLYGKVDYLIADYSHMDNDLRDAIIQNQSIPNLFREINRFMEREKGLRAAAEIDGIVSHDGKAIRTVDILQATTTQRNTKLMLKLDPELATQAKNIKLSQYFSGLLLESNDAVELGNFVKNFPNVKDSSLNNICLLKSRPDNLDGLLAEGYCSRVVVKFDLLNTAHN